MNMKGTMRLLRAQTPIVSVFHVGIKKVVSAKADTTFNSFLM